MFPRAGAIQSPYAAHGVFYMPNNITEGPVRRDRGQTDYVYGMRPVEMPERYSMLGAIKQPIPGFPVYAWRPAGDGTSAYWPHDRDLAPYMGMLPYMEGTIDGVCLQGHCGSLGQYEALQRERVEKPEGEKYAGWKLGLQIVATAALVTVAGFAVAGAVKSRSRRR